MIEEEMFEEFLTFSYTRAHRDGFKEGALLTRWAEQYPVLFDEQDISTATNQRHRGFHFVEWITAVLLYESTGYHSLVTKYQYAYHPKKHKIFRKLVSAELLNFIEERQKTDKTQCPDLFVYHPETMEWFFCEVKGPGDSYKPNQIAYFSELYQITKKPIKRVTLTEITLS